MKRAGDPSSVRAPHGRRSPGPETSTVAGRLLDIGGASLFVLLGAWAFAVLPQGDPLRLALALPVLFFAPGYLLIQSLLVPVRSAATRSVHGLIAVGISPALVGLIALATSVVPGGFRPVPIVVAVSMTSLVLGGIAFYRRSHVGVAAPAVTREPHRAQRGGDRDAQDVGPVS